jgi:hypothetical protein
VPKFAIRLESPDLVNEAGDPHFREVRLSADDEAEAVARCEQKERELAAHQYPDEDVKAWEKMEAAASDAGEPLAKGPRGRLATHRQSKPYEVVSVEEV